MTLLSAVRIVALCALALAARAAAAAEAVYALDPVHTRVMFSVSHAGFSNPMFTVAGTTGMLAFDPDDWSTARVEARIPIDGLELADAKWRGALLGRNFLEADQYPEARFVSTRIAPIDATHATMFGMLTLRNVTREVKLDVELHQVKRHPLPPFRRTAGFTATGTLSRRMFAITAWPNVVGDAVEIRIEAEGRRVRGGDAFESGPDLEPDSARDPEQTPDDAEPAAPSALPAPASTTWPVPASTTMPPSASTHPAPAASEPATPP